MKTLRTWRPFIIIVSSIAITVWLFLFKIPDMQHEKRMKEIESISTKANIITPMLGRFKALKAMPSRTLEEIDETQKIRERLDKEFDKTFWDGSQMRERWKKIR